ncbi:MAG: hypothetical protein KAU90_11265, partial [Sulfurovaceae bacterium]|nr:hypothetical protein [Sulfurovaceae bacterium]
MRNKIYILVVLFSFIISGCGEITTTDGTIVDNQIGTINNSSSSDSTDNITSNLDNDNNEINTTSSNKSLKIIGKITYDRVWVNSNGIGLDYNHITKEPSKQVIVKAIGVNNQVIASTTTDDNGNYRLNNLPSNTRIKVQVYAKMKKNGIGGWDIKVIDNTNSNSQYVMESNPIDLTNNSLRVNLNAQSGWGGYSYTGKRTSAPFAILDSIYQAIQKVLSANRSATFPSLLVNWSENNVPSGNGDEAELRDGQIVTSHYDGNQQLWILGDANSDTDEYDNHIIIHEWGHYFE